MHKALGISIARRILVQIVGGSEHNHWWGRRENWAKHSLFKNGEIYLVIYRITMVYDEGEISG